MPLLILVLMAGQFRGPDRDGQVHVWPDALRSAENWPAELEEVWRVPVGLGHASPLVDGDSVLLFARRGEDEALHRLDLADGSVEWTVSNPAPHAMHRAALDHGPGPKSTPTLDGGLVFTLGISGILSAHDAATGELRWRRRRYEETPLYGTGSSPLARDGRVFVHVGGTEDGILAALDAETGETIWEVPDAPAYVSPAVAPVAGLPTLMTMSLSRILLLRPDNGRVRWETPFRTPYDQNVANPLALGDVVVFGGLDHPTFAVRFSVEGESLVGETVWEADRTRLYMSSPVLAGGRLFAFGEQNSGQFIAFDPATGADVWRSPPRSGENAAFLVHGETVLALTEQADLMVLDAAKPDFRPVRTYSVAPSPTWAQPVPVADGFLIKDETHLARLRAP